jgi:hypothetical protein
MYIIVLQRYTKFALCGSSLLKTIYYPQERKNFKQERQRPLPQSTMQQANKGYRESRSPLSPFISQYRTT